MENFDRQNITAKRTSGRRLFLFISTASALVADIIVIALLAAAGITAFGYLLCPIVLFVADVAFLIFAIFSNFRFKYSLVGTIVFAVAETVLIAVMLFTHVGDTRAVSVAAGLLWLGFHVIVVIATIVLALGAANLNKGLRSSAIVLSALVALCAIGYGVFAVAFGVFGQGFLTGRRTLTFTLDDSGEGYIASGYVDGRGNRLVVPDKFDGKPVTGINCDMLVDDGISAVEFESESVLALYNVESLMSFKLDAVGVKRSVIDAVRADYFKQVYQYTQTNTTYSYARGLAKFVEAIYPIDIAKDETYVTFDYSSDDFAALKATEGDVLPVWIGKKGSATFDIKSFDNEYAKHGDCTSQADLDWNYKNNGRIMVVTDDETILDGAKIGEPIKGATVSFDKIFKVYVGADNDDVYATPDSYTHSDYGDFNYIVGKTADSYIAGVPSRDGFDVSWTLDDGGNFSKLSNILDDLQNVDTDEVTVHAVWALHAPVIKSIVSDKSNNIVTYGDGVQFSATVDAPATGFALDYEWSTKTGMTLVENADKASVALMGIDGSGDYTVTVTASAPDITSLTSQATDKIKIAVTKRPIRFSWSTLTDDVYSATEKPVSCSYTAADVVAGDSITFTQTSNSLLNAGTTSVGVSLTGDAAKKYNIVSGSSQTYNIKPRDLAVTWSSSRSFVYDGNIVAPTASATPLIATDTPDHDKLNVVVTGGQKNYGTYTAQVSVGNKNYNVTNPTCTFEITKRPLTASWDKNSFEYNGMSQHPTIESIINAVSGEASAILDGITYTGARRDVGNSYDDNYRVTATLPETGVTRNYSFASGSDSYGFEITQKHINVSIAGATKTYDGNKYTAFSATTQELAAGDNLSTSVALDYSYSKGDGISAGEHIITATATSKNYDVTVYDGTLTVNKRTVTIAPITRSVDYKGAAYTDGFEYRVSNLVAGEAEDTVLGNIAFSFKQGDNAVTGPKNSGAYTMSVSADLLSENYALDASATATFTIRKVRLTVTAREKTKVYDGKEFTAFECTSDGLKGDDKLAEVMNVSYYVTPDVPGNTPVTEVRPVDAGSYIIHIRAVKDAANYEISCVGSKLTITQKAITVTTVSSLSDGATSKVYDGTPFAYTYSAPDLCDGDTLNVTYSITKDGDSFMGNIVDVGTYVVTPRADAHNNYNITCASATFAITPKALTVATTSATDSKPYDGKPFEYGYSAPALLSRDTLNVTYSIKKDGAPFTGSIIDAGVYVVTPVVSHANYTITCTPKTLTVDKAALTVTADNKSKIYDGRAYTAFTCTPSGLVNGESLNAVTTVSYTCAATDAGTHTIVIEAAAAKNYTITCENGTLTISKKALTITADNKNKTYDGGAYTAFTCTPNGLVNNESLSAVTTVSYTCNGTTAGTHTIAVSATDAKNYTIECKNGTLTINKATLTITADDKSKTYDGAPFTSFTCTPSGLVGGDTLASVTDVSYTCSDKNAGTHTIVVSATDATNYNIACVNGTLTISKATITITAANKSKTYDGNPFTDVYSVSAVDTGYSVVWTPYEEFVNVGTLDVTITARGNNYETAEVKITLTINAATVTLDWGEVKSEYTQGENIVIDPTASAEVGLTVKYFKDGVEVSAPSEVGEYTVKVEKTNGNYEWAQGTELEKTFTVVPEPEPEAPETSEEN